MCKFVDESFLFFSQNSLQNLSTFHGYKSIYSEKECEKSLFSKTMCTGESLATWMSCEFQSPDNRMAKPYFLSCSGLAVLTLQLPTCSTHVPHTGESPLASQSRDPVVSCLLMHTLDQFFTLSHTQPSHYSHLNIGFLDVELQANLARNKANTQLNKFNFTIIY